jgi:hypothetical protein
MVKSISSTFMYRFRDIFVITPTRKNKLFSIIQYSFLYLILVSSLGYFIDRLFPRYNEQKRKVYIFLEVSIQIIISSLVIYYIREFVSIFPLIFDTVFVNKSSIEYQGDIIISIVLLSVQRNLANKIYFLARETEPKIVKEIVKTTKETTTEVVKDTTKAVKDTTKQVLDTTAEIVKDVSDNVDKV